MTFSEKAENFIIGIVCEILIFGLVTYSWIKSLRGKKTDYSDF